MKHLLCNMNVPIIVVWINANLYVGILSCSCKYVVMAPKLRSRLSCKGFGLEYVESFSKHVLDITGTGERRHRGTWTYPSKPRAVIKTRAYSTREEAFASR